MILAGEEVRRLIQQGKIRVEPLNEKNIGPASLDLTLGNEFRRISKKKVNSKNKLTIKNNKIKLVEGLDYRDFTELIKVKPGKTISIKPGEMLLGETKEVITVSNSLVGKLDGRSRFARIGLMIHFGSSFIQPGVSNVQVLEITNLSNVTLELVPGVRICQVIFSELKGTGHHSGIFSNQKSI